MVSATDAESWSEATPALVVDLSVVERNVARLADYARQHRLAVRPHTKTHKSIRMAQLQLAAGAVGLTVAKVGEAAEMSHASKDILIAFPAIDRHRRDRIVELARDHAVRVAVDTPDAVDRLEAAAREAGVTVGVLVDIDAGFHRTGAQSPAAALELARRVSRAGPRLRLDGIFFYPGHVWAAHNEQADELARIDAILAESLDLWKRSGLEAAVVSGGSTPTAYQSHLVTSQTEIRPGTYLYNDMNTVRAGFCSLDDCAARIVCTVVSTAVPEKVVIDAGTKTLTSDRNVKFPDSGFGHVVEHPQATVVRLSEEHGEIDVSACARRPKVGERLTIIPNHICPCVNLQDAVWLRHGDGGVEPMTVDTRGRLS